jgi:carbamoyl-phosphate synthase large subunit
MSGVPYFTTMAAATAAIGAIERLRGDPLTVRSLQEYHGTAEGPNRR